MPIVRWKKPIWKVRTYDILTTWCFRKGQVTETVNRSVVATALWGVVLVNRQHRTFLGQWKYCLWYHNGGYMFNTSAQIHRMQASNSELYGELRLLVKNNASALAHGLQQMCCSNPRYSKGNCVQKKGILCKLYLRLNFSVNLKLLQK